MSAIDLSVVQELLDLCDEDDLELLVELIEVFLRDAPGRISEIIEGCAAGDLEQVAYAAHALKGSAGNLGAVTVQRLADGLQEAGRDGDIVAARASSRELSIAFGDAADELRELATRFGAR